MDRNINRQKTIGKCSSENDMSSDPEFISPKKYAKQTTLNTHALIQKTVFIYSENVAINIVINHLVRLQNSRNKDPVRN